MDHMPGARHILDVLLFQKLCDLVTFKILLYSE